MGRPETDGNVLANVIEASFDKSLETKTLKQEELVVGEYIAVSIV